MPSLAVAAAVALIAAPALAAAAPPAACDVTLYVADQDPNGLNVRAEPNGTILTALKAKTLAGPDPGSPVNRVDVHVNGAAGAWAAIDTATLVEINGSGETTLFKGQGFVAFSKLGIVQFMASSAILAEPAANARKLLMYNDPDPEHLPRVDVLGCSGPYVQLRIHGVIGWTRDF